MDEIDDEIINKNLKLNLGYESYDNLLEKSP